MVAAGAQFQRLTGLDGDAAFHLAHFHHAVFHLHFMHLGDGSRAGAHAHERGRLRRGDAHEGAGGFLLEHAGAHPGVLHLHFCMAEGADKQQCR
ncbi:hypothetical protein SDC9_206000 [bioreactor metagenome]|uniref:Uncharacterized protein n=1 Tax=bioreactor metagenome TaxID=1076179 RepID=A0A645J4H8_9ZZZZ